MLTNAVLRRLNNYAAFKWGYKGVLLSARYARTGDAWTPANTDLLLPATNHNGLVWDSVLHDSTADYADLMAFPLPKIHYVNEIIRIHGRLELTTKLPTGNSSVTVRIRLQQYTGDEWVTVTNRSLNIGVLPNETVPTANFRVVAPIEEYIPIATDYVPDQYRIAVYAQYTPTEFRIENATINVYLEDGFVNN